MAADLSRIQIMRLKVRTDSDEYLLEIPVPYLGDVVREVLVTGLGDPKKLAGDWQCVPLEEEVWSEIIGQS
jgi:hypothetical protein